MKIKLLLLSLLFPLASFGANTNLFDNVFIRNVTGMYTNPVPTVTLNMRTPIGGGGTGLIMRADAALLAPFISLQNNAGVAQLVINQNGIISVIEQSTTSSLTKDSLKLTLAAGTATILNNTATASSDISLASGTGPTSTAMIRASNVQIASFQTNMVSIGTNALVRVVTIGPNTSSRGRGIVVSSINTVTNSLIQPFFGTYEGAPTPVTFAVAYAVPPTGSLGSVTATTNEPGGTALANDTVWVTNVTTTGCVIGYRTAGGVDSAATITFNGIVLGRQ